MEPATLARFALEVDADEIYDIKEYSTFGACVSMDFNGLQRYVNNKALKTSHNHSWFCLAAWPEQSFSLLENSH